MNMHAVRIILFLSIFLCVHFNIANANILPSDLSRSHISGNGTNIDSFDFRIENIEFDGIFLGSITTLRKHNSESFSMFSNGGQLIYTNNGIRVNVTNGYVTLSFLGYAGLVTSFVSSAGNCFDFEPESFTIKTSANNTKDILVHFDGVDYFIPPGNRSQIVEIEIIPETKSHEFKPNIRGNIPVVIFGSAHLDVSTINIESLCFENLAMRKIGKAHILSTSKHVDNDEYPDLIVGFKDISHILNGDISLATLKGKLSDGTIIFGNGNSFIHS